MSARAPCPRPRSRQAGFALVLVLGIVAVAATLATGLATTVRYEVRRIANAGASAEARALLDAGVALGVMGATDPDPARRLRTDGSPRMVGFAEGRIELRVFEDAGRLDLNREPVSRLAALFTVADVPDPADLARAVAAWRGDWDGGAASADGLPRRPFLSVDELAAVPGVPPSLTRRLGEALTVDGPAGGLVPSVAGPMVRAALSGLPDQLLPTIGRIVSVRVRVTGPAGGAATAEATVLLLDPPDPVPYRVLEWREPVPFLPGNAP